MNTKEHKYESVNLHLLDEDKEIKTLKKTSIL